MWRSPHDITVPDERPESERHVPRGLALLGTWIAMIVFLAVLIGGVGNTWPGWIRLGLLAWAGLAAILLRNGWRPRRQEST